MRIRTILKSVMASFLLLSAVSCQEKLRFSFTKGEAVKFSVGTAGSSTDTKAVYAGNTTTPGEKERIDWQTGDLIRIYCAQASETHSADYKVTDDITSSGAVSKAHIEGTGGVGLRWGEGSHTFYAVYPSPASSGITTGIEGKDVAATLASEQGYKDASSAEGSWTVTPDPKWMLMTAKSGPYKEEYGIPSGKENVFLDFHPLTTAVKFTVTNGTTSAMPIKKVMLISKASKISGTFSVDLDASPSADGYLPTGGTPAGTEVSIDLSAKSISLAAGKSLTFTFFLAPTQDIDDLTFKFYKDGSTWMSTRLGYTDGSGVKFPRCKKTEVKGVMLPNGAQWTVKYGPAGEDAADAVTVVTSWNTGVNTDLQLNPLPVHEYVDLGLSVLWATCNVGASAPEDFGDYFAWAATEPWYEPGYALNPVGHWKPGKEGGYNWNNTPYQQTVNPLNQDTTTWSKYTTDGEILELMDDAANANWGNPWRMPTQAEFEELIDNTEKEFTSIMYDGSRHYGCLFTSKKVGYEDKSIFIPAAGCYIGTTWSSGSSKYLYWSSLVNINKYQAQKFFFQSNKFQTGVEYRYLGCPVRPVKPKAPTE